ncbi:endonuclease/exonuclease/phosphatase family protein [Amycolatopsis pigmentata]|uniref:Endonuclease/exonuclease/phosphatase family protein n=1 Tax=Amycolatopsis pigmentata TaxID=450801 RepID=A0ABW5GAB0_9PSEU
MSGQPLMSDEGLQVERVTARVGRRTWCRATRLLVSCALLWLGFVFAQWFLSGHWWVWLLVGAIPPFLFVLVPLLLLAGVLVLLACRIRLPVAARWWVAVAGVLAGILGFGQSGINVAALTGNPDGAVPPGAIHVFSWNTEYWDQNDDASHFYDYLKAQHADVYLLQEHMYWDESKDEKGAIQLKDIDQLRQEFPGYTVVAKGELLTLSRFPVLGWPHVSAADWWADFTTGKVLRTDLRVGTTTLSVYNVHIPVQVDMNRSPLHADFYGYTREADDQRHAQFSALTSDVGANPKPVLIAGDFNTSPAMADLAGLRSITADAARAARSLYPASWQAGSWMRFWRLDWAFTMHGVRVHRYEFEDPQGMSDHDAQDLTISLPD